MTAVVPDIDPTQVGGQACDVGDEYRSMIFTHDAEQMKQAQAYKDSLKTRFGKPIAVAASGRLRGRV